MENVTKVLLEAGRVRRLHTVPLIQHYDVAQHSWNMATLLLTLHPNPTLNLLRAVLLHDAHERWTGDVPAPIKWDDPTLASALHRLEEKAQTALGIKINLDEGEQRWLRALDILELYLFCTDEMEMGNRQVRGVINKCHDVLWGGNGVPDEVRNYLVARTYTNRTKDGWME